MSDNPKYHSRNLNVRVRFAPSPTGELHVGNVRAALFNWFFARHHGGTFVLRVEDTDRERSTEEGVRSILDGLRWLGLDWDEGPDIGGDYGPYFQSQRLEMHQTECRRLLESGRAYPCFCTKEELAAKAEKARAEKRAYGYGGKCRNLSPEEAKKRIDAGEPHTVRFRVPDGVTHFKDQIRGTIRFDNIELEDFIILKGDGTPVYHMAVVVDDGLMKITHVIRGEDHLSNTARHALLFDALEYDLPQFAHLPIIKSASGGKLSKREGDTSITAFRDKGYLPEAMLNFLTLIGWSPGDDREILSLEETVQLFTLEGVNKATGLFDTKKLDWLNGQYLRTLSDEELSSQILPYLHERGWLPDPLPEEKKPWFKRLLGAVRERLTVASDVVSLCDFCFEDFSAYEEKGVRKHFRKAGVETHLEGLRGIISTIEPFSAKPIEEKVKEYVESKEIGLGKVIHPGRLALTGKTVGLPFFDTVELIGREKCLSRLEAAFQFIKSLPENG